MPVTPLQVVLPETTQQGTSSGVSSSHPELLNSMLSGKPLVALAFSDMKVGVSNSALCLPGTI
jgi:hypothetical protein